MTKIFKTKALNYAKSGARWPSAFTFHLSSQIISECHCQLLNSFCSCLLDIIINVTLLIYHFNQLKLKEVRSILPGFRVLTAHQGRKCLPLSAYLEGHASLYESAFKVLCNHSFLMSFKNKHFDLCD
jgi:hypothetical protein